MRDDGRIRIRIHTCDLTDPDPGGPKTYGPGSGTLSTAHTHRVDPTFQDVSNPDPTLELKQVKQEGLQVLRSIDTVHGFVY